MLVAGLLNFVSSAVSFTLVIDDPSRISVNVNGTELTMVAGDNPISVAEYTYVNFTATEGSSLIHSIYRLTYEIGCARNDALPYYFQGKSPF